MTIPIALIVGATFVGFCDEPKSFGDFVTVLNEGLNSSAILTNLDNADFFVVERWDCGYRIVLYPLRGDESGAIHVSWDGKSETAQVRRPQ
jgi:hypothetical protein